MTIHEFRKLIDSIDDSIPEYSDKRVTVRVSGEYGIGSVPSTEVTHVFNGFDLDSWQVVLLTEDALFRN